MDEILFVTTSTKKMFDFSGSKLIDSFLKYQDGKIIYYTENFELPKKFVESSQIIEKNIENDYYLITWIKKYSEYIPIEFGGLYDYRNDLNSLDRYLTPLRTKDWNYKFSLWFRKIVALYIASKFFGTKYNYIIWIDNDCEIKKNMNIDFIKSLFNNREVFYFMGNKRKEIDFGIESGFLGFKKINNNYEIINKIFNYYNDGNFLNHKRWDDGYILKYILDNDLKFNDVVKNSNKINVMENENIIKYIIHKKGDHWRNNIDYILKKNKDKKEFNNLLEDLEKIKLKKENKLIALEDKLSNDIRLKNKRHHLIYDFFLEISRKKPIFKIYKKINDLLLNNELKKKDLKQYIFNYLDNKIRLKLKYKRDIDFSYKNEINKHIKKYNNIDENFNIYNIKYDNQININLNINNKIIKILNKYLYIDKNIVHFSSKINLIEYLLGYFPINNMPKYLLNNLEIFVIGKGPSLKSFIKRENDKQIIVAINDAANICKDIDFLCINDEYNFDMIDKNILKSVKNIIMLTNPHLNTVQSDKSIRQGSIKEYTYIDLYNKLNNLNCNAKIHLCSIHTSFIKKNNILDLGKVYSSGDTAISFFIKNGFKNIKTVGIGKTIGYSKLTKRKISKSKVIKTTNEEEWYTENFNNIIYKLKRNNIKYNIT
jgi:hypothetical protein